MIARFLPYSTQNCYQAVQQCIGMLGPITSSGLHGADWRHLKIPFLTEALLRTGYLWTTW